MKHKKRVPYYSSDHDMHQSVFAVQEKCLLVYRKHYFASRNQNFQYKRGILFLESKTEDTDSVAASEVSSWIGL